MEAIREYLSNMFMSLPETPEVLRAKAELMEMMEDKYEELIREGKSEKEAVGIVISEFGNLEELAKELGIDKYMERNQENSDEKQNAEPVKNKPVKKKYEWRFEDVKGYIEYAWRHAAFIAVGVMLCIWSPYISAVLDGAESAGYVNVMFVNFAGTTSLFAMVAVAVGLFCGASAMRKKYGNVARFSIMLDEKAEHYIWQKQEKDEQSRLILRIVGVILCIMSVVPSSVNYFENEFLSEIMDSSVLILVGVGVLLLVISSSVNNRYKELEKALINEGSGRGIPYPEGYKKKKMPAAIIVVLVVFGLLVAGATMAAALYMPVNSLSGYEEVQRENSYDIADTNTISMDLDMGSVNIEMADVEQLQFKYDGDSKYAPVVSCKNGEFRIQEKGQDKWFNFEFSFLWRGGKRAVTVVIPAKRTDLAYYIETDASNIKLKNLHGKKADFDVDAGNLEGTGCTFEEKSTVEMDAGNVSFENSVFKFLQGEVDAGNFSIESAVPLSYYDLDFDVDMGKIKVNGENVGDTYRSLNQHESGEEYHMTIEADMGNIDVSESSGRMQ